MVHKTHLECDMRLNLKENTKAYFSRKFVVVVQTFTNFLQNLVRLVNSKLLENIGKFLKSLEKITKNRGWGLLLNLPISFR